MANEPSSQKNASFYGNVLPFFLFRIPMSCVFGFYSGRITWEFDANLVRERQLEEGSEYVQVPFAKPGFKVFGSTVG